MDDLLEHLVEELAMDGQQGTDLDRFTSWIADFHRGATLVDDSYRDYVFKWLFHQQTCVQVGTRVPAQPPPDKPGRSPCIDTVETLPRDQVKGSSLSQLAAQHGKELRITVDIEVSRFALTDTTDPKNLAGAAWPAVQIIARGRANAVAALDIGRAIGVDQRNIFAVFKKLIDQRLVAKFMNSHGKRDAKGNLLLHKRYWKHNHGLLPIKTKADGDGDGDGEGDADETQDRGEDAANDDADQRSATNDDNGHQLVSAPLCLAILSQPDAMLERLLRYVTEEGVPRDGLWQRLGFPLLSGIGEGPLDDAVQQGIQAGLIKTTASHLRLTERGRDKLAQLNAPSSSRAGIATAERQVIESTHTFQANFTFERQVMEAIRDAGSNGITTREVTERFRAAGRAIRHFDEYMHSSEAAPSEIRGYPDLCVISVFEMNRRIKRTRMWNARGLLDHGKGEAGFEDWVEALEALDPRPYVGFAPLEACYTSIDELQQNILSKPRPNASSSSNKKRKKEDAATPPSSTKRKKSTPAASSSKTKKATPAKTPTNPIDPATGRPKKGRPRKSADATSASAAASASTSTPAKRPRGRPRKSAGASATSAAIEQTEMANAEDDGVSEASQEPQAKRLRARERQRVAETPTMDESPSANRARGRGKQDVATSQPTLSAASWQRAASSQVREASQDVESSYGATSQVAEDSAPAATPLQSLDVSSTSTPDPAQSQDVSAVSTPRHIKRRASEVEAEALAAAIPISDSEGGASTPSRASTPTSSQPRTSTNRSRAIPAAPARARINIAAVRRETKFLDYLERCGGIADVMELGLLWIDEITKDKGEGASAVLKEVGDLRDSKTRQRMLDSLISKGKIKTHARMEAQKETAKGQPKTSKLRKLVYLPDLEDSKLQAAIKLVEDGQAVYKIDGSRKHKSALRRVKTDQVSNFNAETLGAVAQSEKNNLVETLPIEELLNDPQHRKHFAASTLALSQSYGFMAGEMFRLSKVHQHIMQHLDADGAVTVSELLPSLPLSLVVAIKRVESDNDVFKAALQDGELMAKPISQQDVSVQVALDTLDQDAFGKWFEETFLSRLQFLHLAAKVTSASDRWQLKHDSLDDGDISWRGPPGSGAMTSLRDATEYWAGLKEHRDVVAKNLRAAGCADSRLISLMGNPKAWRHDKQVTMRQKLFLKRFIKWPDPEAKETGSVLHDEETLRKISDVCLAPVELVKATIEAYCKKHEDDEQKAKLKKEERAERARKAKEQRDQEDAEYQERQRKREEERKAKKAKEKADKKAQKKAAKAEQAGVALDEDNLDGIETPPLSPGRQEQARQRKEQARQQKAAEIENLKRRRNPAHRRVKEWCRAFEQACRESGIDDLQSDKLFSELRSFRDDYREGKGGDSDEGVSLNVLKDMIRLSVEAKQQAAIEAAAAAQEKEREEEEEGEEEDNEEDEEDASPEPPSKGGKQAPKRRRRKRGQERFTRATDELLRDACVILRARDKLRPNGRPNWSSLKKIFPDDNGVVLRNRFNQLSRAVGETEYLDELEATWTKKWEMYRGTTLLPDRDWTKAGAFDLQTHIDFLRNNINKDDVLDSVEKAAKGEELAEEPEGQWVLRAPLDRRQPTFSIVHDTTENLHSATEKRNELLTNAFAFSNAGGQGGAKRREHMAECLIRMFIESPETDPDKAVTLLEAVGEDYVEEAAQRMVKAKIVKVRLDGHRGPGNNFTWANERSNNPLAPFLEHAQEALEAEEDLRAMSSPASIRVDMGDSVGRTIAVVQMLVDGEADVDIDLEQLTPLRDQIYFNGKLVPDIVNEVELEVQVLQSEGAVTRMPAPPQGSAAGRDGLGDDGDDVDERFVTAGEDGILARDLDDATDLFDSRRNVFSTGYDDLRLVSSRHRSAWSLINEYKGLTVAPRSWIKWSSGRPVRERWRRALLAAYTHILTRPGLSLEQLSARMEPQYDRVEVREIVSAGLEKMGLVEQRPSTRGTMDADLAIVPKCRAGGGAWYRFEE